MQSNNSLRIVPEYSGITVQTGVKSVKNPQNSACAVQPGPIVSKKGGQTEKNTIRTLNATHIHTEDKESYHNSFFETRNMVHNTFSHRETVGNVNRRFGAAVVELAFSLPLIILIVFGSIEACNAIYLQQVVTEVAYQGALVGNQFDATEQDMLDRMQDYVDQTSFSGITFDVVGTDGTPFDDLVRGQSYRVTVTARADSMPLTMQILLNLNDLSAARVAARQ